jgi:hypothetical protein
VCPLSTLGGGCAPRPVARLGPDYYDLQAVCREPSIGLEPMTPSLPWNARWASGFVESRPVWVLGARRDSGRPARGGDLPQHAPEIRQKRPQKSRDTIGLCGSNCTASELGTATIWGHADVAQLVEHLHGKEGVRGSSPRVGLARIWHS